MFVCFFRTFSSFFRKSFFLFFFKKSFSKHMFRMKLFRKIFFSKNIVRNIHFEKKHKNIVRTKFVDKYVPKQNTKTRKHIFRKENCLKHTVRKQTLSVCRFVVFFFFSTAIFRNTVFRKICIENCSSTFCF